MDSLRKKAKELLESNAVQVVIGYENGTAGNVRAAFITRPEQVDRLVFDDRCKQNIAGYLLKHEVKHFGKRAIVATLPVMRSILVLMSEEQVKEEEIVVLGISPDKQLLDFASIDVMENHVQKADLANAARDQEILNKLKAMTREERWNFWQEQLKDCFKCYACRSACPMCYCVRCAVEVNQPQWITVQSNPVGNYEWHTLRTMHLAGRCVGCGECGRACPLDIPVHLLTMQTIEDVDRLFGAKVGLSKNMPSVLSNYQLSDKESFIK